jgi:glycosyltransferase involved in cell wall biosynthesis
VLVRNFANFRPLANGSTPHDRAIIYTGEITPDYGAFNLLGIAREMKARGLDTPLLIVDRFPEPELREQVLKAIEDENLPIQILARVLASEMPQMLQKACIGIAPSPNVLNKALGPPTKLFEYMHFRLAIVGSDIEGTRIALRDGELGILCQPEDYVAWVDAFEKLLNDSAYFNALTERAYAVASRDYTWASEKMGMIDYVRALIARQATRSGA